MRLVLLLVLVGCGGASSEISGSAGGVDFEDTRFVYFGGPYVVISTIEVECLDLAWVARNYEEGVAPTDLDTALVQFAFADNPDADLDMLEGRHAVAPDAGVTSTVVSVVNGAATFTTATAGLFTVDTLDEEDLAEGVLEAVTFEDGGSVSGSYTAEWCRNLR